MRGKPFFRRMGCFFILFTFFAFTGFLAFLRFVLAPFLNLEGPAPLNRPDFIFPFGIAVFFILVAAVFRATTAGDVDGKSESDGS